MKIKFTSVKLIGIASLILAITLTYKWFDIAWYKSLILFILYGWSLNLSNMEDK